MLMVICRMMPRRCAFSLPLGMTALRFRGLCTVYYLLVQSELPGGNSRVCSRRRYQCGRLYSGTLRPDILEEAGEGAPSLANPNSPPAVKVPAVVIGVGTSPMPGHPTVICGRVAIATCVSESYQFSCQKPRFMLPRHCGVISPLLFGNRWKSTGVCPVLPHDERLENGGNSTGLHREKPKSMMPLTTSANAIRTAPRRIASAMAMPFQGASVRSRHH